MNIKINNKMRTFIRGIAAVVVAVVCMSSYSLVFASNDADVNRTADLTVAVTAIPTAMVDGTYMPDVTCAPTETPYPEKKIFSNGKFVYKVNWKKMTANIRNYKGESRAMVIPAKIDGYKVTGFNPDTVRNRHKIKKVYIPETVKWIHEDESEDGGYFLGWENLRKIKVSKDNTVFQSDRGILINKIKGWLLVCPENNRIKKYVVPENIKFIWTYAFAMNKHISRVYINHDGVAMLSYAFQSSGLKSITVKGETPRMDWCVFYDCKNLETVKWRGGFKYIYNGTFEGCKKLKKLIIPSSVRYFDYIPIFTECDSLEVIRFEKAIKKKALISLSGCKNLKKVYWPKSAKKLDASILPKGCKVIRW